MDVLDFVVLIASAAVGGLFVTVLLRHLVRLEEHRCVVSQQVAISQARKAWEKRAQAFSNVHLKCPSCGARAGELTKTYRATSLEDAGKGEVRFEVGWAYCPVCDHRWPVPLHESLKGKGSDLKRAESESLGLG